MAASGLTLCASTTTRNCPLTPGPKPSAIISADLRCVVSRFEVVSEGRAICRLSTGIDRAPKPRTTTAMTNAGNRWTSDTQLRPMERSVKSFAGRFPGPGLPATPGSLTPKDRSPHAPSSAGIRVRAMRTAMATVTAAAKPIHVRNSICASASAISAVKTVNPANTTEDPAVPVAKPAASAAGRCFRSCR